MGENVSAIIPAFNEEEYILDTLEGIRKVSGINEIIVVDDGSTDSTYELLKKEKGIMLLKNGRNRGKGYAIRKGLKYANNDYVALVDADLRESAAEFGKLVDRINREDKAVIVGMLPRAKIKGGFGIVKLVSYSGMYLLTAIKVNSILSGQRVLPVSFLREMEFPPGFALEFKITLEAIRGGFKLIEVPVNIRHRETGRDVAGFLHRGRQCCDICRTIKRELIRRQGIQ